MSVVKIVLRKKYKVDGTSPLALRITKDRKSSFIYLGYHILKDDWDPIKQRVKKSYPNSVRMNNLLIKKLSEATDKALELDTNRDHVSSKAMKQKVKPKGGANFFGQADLYIENLRLAGKYNRYNADKSKVQHIKDFLGNSDIAFSDITVPLLERFKQYCLTDLKVGERTAINHWVVIRSVISQAIKTEIADPKYYPFGRGKLVIKFPDTKKVGLSIAEVQKIEQVELINPLHNHARNIWLFSFYFGGMRGSDVLRLKWSDFKNERLHYTMGKNLKAGSLKTPEKVYNILKIYEAEKRTPDDFIFPELKMFKNLDDMFAVQKQISNSISRLDTFLKEHVALKAKISNNLTMHIARHTFGNIAGGKIPLKMAQKIFRHSSLLTTAGYMNNFNNEEEDRALDDVINFKLATDNNFKKDKGSKKVVGKT